jgi:hypothetical protein
VAASCAGTCLEKRIGAGPRRRCSRGWSDLIHELNAVLAFVATSLDQSGPVWTSLDQSGQGGNVEDWCALVMLVVCGSAPVRLAAEALDQPSARQDGWVDEWMNG